MGLDKEERGVLLLWCLISHILLPCWPAETIAEPVTQRKQLIGRHDQPVVILLLLATSCHFLNGTDLFLEVPLNKFVPYFMIGRHRDSLVRLEG